MVGYRIPTDATDEYYRLGESTTIESTKCFVLAIRECFEGEILLQPTQEDLEKHMAINMD